LIEVNETKGNQFKKISLIDYLGTKVPTYKSVIATVDYYTSNSGCLVDFFLGKLLALNAHATLDVSSQPGAYDLSATANHGLSNRK